MFTVRMCAHRCMWKPKDNLGVIFQEMPSLFFPTRSFLDLELLRRLVSPGPTCPHLASSGVINMKSDFHMESDPALMLV